MFLANENFPLPGINLLRKQGYTVISIQEESPSISDIEVIEIAIARNLIILTFDKDYGELIFRYVRKILLLLFSSGKKEIHHLLQHSY